MSYDRSFPTVLLPGQAAWPFTIGAVILTPGNSNAVPTRTELSISHVAHRRFLYCLFVVRNLLLRA